MRLLFKTTDYNETIKAANNLTGVYNKPVIFHCYWNGNLNEKHLYSIISCYYFNVLNKKHKIILWLENNVSNKYNEEIKKYAEIKNFDIITQINNTFLKNYRCKFSNITYRSDFIRSFLLYNFGGCWFDLDCLFLRDFDPIFCNYENEICLYQWENQNYPNNAIYISLSQKSEKMKKNIEFIIKRNKGWGFQEANLTYDLPLDCLVLPCSWFDPAWINNPCNFSFANFFNDTETEYTFDNFFKGAFCFHWHNKWNQKIEDKSIIKQLINIIISNIETNKA